MRKINYLFISIILLNLINACAGYKPIYTSDLKFEISDYSIKSDPKLGNQIYSKLYNLSKSNRSQNDANIKNIAIIIDTSKEKNATVKDDAGKVLEHKIILTSHIIIKNYSTGDEIVNKVFSETSSYAVQDQYSETIKLEKKNIEDIINKIYQNLLISISENMLVQ